MLQKHVLIVAKLLQKQIHSHFLVGIVGTLSWGDAYVQNCYNTGDIVSLSRDYYFTGEIVGDFYNALKYENCYSIGKTIYNNQIILGNLFKLNETKAKNVYVMKENYGSIVFDENQVKRVKTASEMKTQDFVTLLNENDNANGSWIIDSQNINNGYPILKWQLDR